MTDTPNHGTEPILTPQDAPDHGPNFWANLENGMTNSAPDVAGQEGLKTAAMAAVVSDNTSEMQRVNVEGAPAVPFRSQRSKRTMWPLAAAAGLLVVVGLGFVIAQRAGDSGKTAEVVAGEIAPVEVAPLDGPDDNLSSNGGQGSDSQNTDSQNGDTAVGDSPTVDVAAADGAADGSSDDAGAQSTTATPVSGAGPAGPPIPDFQAALGAVGDPVNLPLDQGLPADATFLASWGQRGVTWYAVTNDDSTCARADYSEIRFVNGSGLTQEVRDPQLTFSGEISHFVVRPNENQAAWLVACGTQLEMYVATLEPDGHIVSQDLVWLGEASTASALVLWEGTEVSVNAIEPNGKVFAVGYDVESKLVSRNGGPSRIILEAGAPAERSLTPLAATPDGGLTYWAGKAPADTVSACRELFGSGVSDTLWLRQGEGQWQLAVSDGTPLGSITAAAIEPQSSQVAFADVCAGEPGRVQVGAQEPDGRISGLREIDLTPYVPGFVAQLHWVDAETLRIETDNSEFGFGAVRFDFRFDESRQTGVIVQLD